MPAFEEQYCNRYMLELRDEPTTPQAETPNQTQPLLESIAKQLDTIMLRLHGMEKTDREYAQQNNTMAKLLDTKVGQFVGQIL